MRSLKVDLELLATDESNVSAISCVADRFEVVPSGTDEELQEWLLRVIAKHDVRGVFAASNLDLPLLRNVKSSVEPRGVRVVVPPENVLALCCDKQKLDMFLTTHHFPTPRILHADEVAKLSVGSERTGFPLVVKPSRGQGSMNTFVVRDSMDLATRLRVVPDPIVQEYVEGTAYTIDFFNNENGQPICIVPRVRAKVSGSSSVFGIVDMKDSIVDLVRQLAAALGGSGLMNAQLIRTPAEELKIHDVNPRLASGVLLSVKAGAPFLRWLIELMTVGRVVSESCQIQDRIVMRKYCTEWFWTDQYGTYTC